MDPQRLVIQPRLLLIYNPKALAVTLAHPPPTNFCVF